MAISCGDGAEERGTETFRALMSSWKDLWVSGLSGRLAAIAGVREDRESWRVVTS